MKSLKNKKGFTIVELVIVIAVIAILAAVMIPTFSNIVQKANESKALLEVKNAYSATLAKDLSNINESDYTFVVYNVTTDIIVKHSNGTLIKISKEGVASVVESGSETHTLKDDGTLEKKQVENANAG